MSGHDHPEQAVTFKRNGWSRWAGICNVDSYPEKFKRIKDGNINLTGKKDGKEFKFTNILECAVRQMAYEILNSQDVQALVHS
ncbi:hypothetical protein [Marinobacter sp. AN1]|uniref:hypothetical protein n=1 Tax=Marinobacter sp. AN1 TaxID=2886046 RepID=UPI00222F841B|nr:hypothetical protein [Marinobacter sp. AN1]UZD65591.1 hypothetical protein LJ360_18780 [Marinobacter sp. AN1]